jgi:hypothetical protein
MGHRGGEYVMVRQARGYSPLLINGKRQAASAKRQTASGEYAVTADKKVVKWEMGNR